MGKAQKLCSMDQFYHSARIKKTPPFQKFLVNSLLNTDSVLQSHSCLVGGQLKQLGAGQCGEIVQSDISERCGAFTHPMWSIASPIRYSGERHATAKWIKAFCEH